MPGRDGTGPLSAGPMSGRGMGYCNRSFRFGVGRGGFPRGGGRTRAWGGGAGNFAGWQGYPRYMTVEDEKRILTEAIEDLSREIDEIKSRLEDIKKQEDK